MPTYKYRRDDGTTFTVQQSMTDDPMEKCPKTGQPVRRVIEPASVLFRGSGFHATDYESRNASA